MKMKQQNKKQIGAGRNFINVQKFEKTLKKLFPNKALFISERSGCEINDRFPFSRSSLEEFTERVTFIWFSGEKFRYGMTFGYSTQNAAPMKALTA